MSALAPLETRLLDHSELSPFDKSKLTSEHKISITPVLQAEMLDWIPGIAGGSIAAFLMIVGTIEEDNPKLRTYLSPWIWYTGPMAILVILASVAIANKVGKNRIYAWIVPRLHVSSQQVVQEST